VLKAVVSYYNLTLGDTSFPPNYLYWLCVPLVLTLFDQTELGGNINEQQSMFADVVESFFALLEYLYNPVNDLPFMMQTLKALLSQHTADLLAHLKQVVSQYMSTGKNPKGGRGKAHHCFFLLPRLGAISGHIVIPRHYFLSI